MPRIRRVFVVALLVATACPGGDGDTPRAVERPVRGGILRVWLAGDVDSLDPHAGARPSSWFFARAMHRGLLAFPDEPYPAGASPVPDIAAALPTVSPDGKRYTFILRSRVRFADDRPVGASDARASIERLLRTGVGVAPFLRVIEGADDFLAGRSPRLAGVRAPDEQTLEVVLSRAATDLPWILAHPQAAIVPAPTPTPADPASIGGLGPYRLARYRPERSISLTRNEAWDSSDPVRRGWVERIEARIGGASGAAVDGVLGGREDVVLDAGPPDLDAVRASPRAPSGVAGSCTRYLFMDTRVEPFDDVRVRRAVAAAVDRSALAPASGPPAGSLLPPASFGHDLAPVIAEDVAAARAALSAAGAGAFTTTMVVADEPRDRREAAAIASALRRVGITVRVRRVPASVLLSDYHARGGRRTPLGLATWCADWPGLAGRGVLGPVLDPRERDRPGRPPPPALRSPALRVAIESASRAPAADAPDRWQAADRLGAGLAVVVPLTWPPEPVIHSPRVRGWGGSPLFPQGDPAGLWLG